MVSRETQEKIYSPFKPTPANPTCKSDLNEITNLYKTLHSVRTLPGNFLVNNDLFLVVWVARCSLTLFLTATNKTIKEELQFEDQQGNKFYMFNSPTQQESLGYLRIVLLGYFDGNLDGKLA